jgi:NAD(P)H-dependent FMN reductase
MALLLELLGNTRDTRVSASTGTPFSIVHDVRVILVSPAETASDIPIHYHAALLLRHRSLKVVAFTGSLRKASVNHGLLRFAQSVGAKHDMNIAILSTQLPLYNSDLEAALPGEVTAFRDAVQGADCLLLGVQEYNFSYSGVLKNALDWTSRKLGGQQPLLGKPVGMIGAGGGMGSSRAQYHLRQVRFPSCCVLCTAFYSIA